MTKTFKYDYEAGSASSLTYEVSLNEDERLDTVIENGKPIVYMNRRAMLTVAKILIKLG